MTDTSDSLKVYHFDSTSVQLLAGIDEINADLVSAYERNFLIAGDQLLYQEPIHRPMSGLKMSKIEKYRKETKKSGPVSYLKIYPNPANSTLTFSYSLEKVETSYSLQFTDILGTMVKNMLVTNNPGQMTISVSDLKHGVYVVSLFEPGKTVKTAKVILIK